MSLCVLMCTIVHLQSRANFLASNPTVDLEAFGRRLATFRVGAGFDTQEAAAEATGIERAQLNRHESGTGGLPRHSTLGRYERAYRLAPGLLSMILSGRDVYVSQSVSRGTLQPQSSAESLEYGTSVPLPKRIRERLNAARGELISLDVDEDLVDGLERSFRANAGFSSYFAGGAPSTEETRDLLDLLEGFVANYKAIASRAMARRIHKS